MPATSGLWYLWDWRSQCEGPELRMLNLIIWLYISATLVCESGEGLRSGTFFPFAIDVTSSCSYHHIQMCLGKQEAAAAAPLQSTQNPCAVWANSLKSLLWIISSLYTHSYMHRLVYKHFEECVIWTEMIITECVDIYHGRSGFIKRESFQKQ